jgi:hypothetical protein
MKYCYGVNEMKNRNISMMAFAIFFLLLNVENSSAGYCESVQKLEDRSTGCTDNQVVYVEAAVDCLEKFEAEAKIVSSALATQLSLGNGANQKGSVTDSKGNYAQAKQSLLNLIAQGAVALKEMQDYQESLDPPEDVESIEEMGISLEDFLAGIPCYDDNRKLLIEVRKDLQIKIAELETARQKALKMESALKDVKMESHNPIVEKDSRVPANEKIKVNPKNYRPSDISGTEKIEKK